MKQNQLKGEKLMPALEDYVLTKIAECGAQPLGEGFAALAGPDKTVSAEKAAVRWCSTLTEQETVLFKRVTERHLVGRHNRTRFS